MRKLTVLLSSTIGLALIAGLWFVSSNNTSNSESVYYVAENGVPTVPKVKEKGANGYKEFLHAVKVNPATGEYNVSDVIAARNQAYKMLEEKKSFRGSLGLKWDEIGPNNVGGRTRAILIDKNDPRRMFAGGVTGGLWLSSDGAKNWAPYMGDDTLCGTGVVSLAQTVNGHIYAGTGERLSNSSPSATTGGATGFVGHGIWKSSDNGVTFKKLAATIPTANSVSSEFANVGVLVAHPTNNDIVLAGTNSGVKFTNDGGTNWADMFPSPAPNILRSGNIDDIEVTPSGSLFITVDGILFKGDIDAPAGIVAINTTANLPGAGSIGRAAIALAPSDENFVYFIATNNQGETIGVYRSTDGGDTFVGIHPSGTPSTSFNPTGTQGWYDLEIAVLPNNKWRAYVGGQFQIWHYTDSSWYGVSQWFTDPSFDQQHVHADHHRIIFHPNLPNTMFIGTDGGIFKTSNAGAKLTDTEPLPIFVPVNKNYNVTQFYSVAASIDGSVLAGAQDNGTQYIDYKGNSFGEAREISGGDGGSVEGSVTNPGALFFAAQNGALRRSSNYGSSGNSYFDQYIDDPDQPSAGESGEPDCGAPFISRFAMYEEIRQDTLNYAYFKSIAEIIKEDSTAYGRFDTLYLDSAKTMVVLGDTLRKTKYGEGRMAVSTGCGTWVGTNALDFSRNPTWFPITTVATQGGIATSYAWSEDGDHLYIGTSSGSITRVSGFMKASLEYDPGDSLNLTIDDLFIGDSVGLTVTRIATLGGYVTEVTVSRKDNGFVVATLGGYGGTQHVFRTFTGDVATAGTGIGPFANISGNLPAAPVLSAVIDFYSDDILVGTDLGMYSLEDGALPSNWQIESTDFCFSPVFELRQLKYGDASEDCYAIYAGTHGRGIWRAVSNKAACSQVFPGFKDKESLNNSTAKLYPNPAQSYTNLEINMASSGKAMVAFYDLNGKLVMFNDLGEMNSGIHTVRLNTENLVKGIYVGALMTGNQQTTLKLVIAK